VKMIQVRLAYLFPAVIVFCVLGTYALNNFTFDIWILIIFAVIGYILNQFQINLITVILAFILGPLIERYFQIAMNLTEGRLSGILERPIAVTFLVIAILFLFYPFATKQVKKHLAKKRAQQGV